MSDGVRCANSSQLAGESLSARSTSRPSRQATPDAAAHPRVARLSPRSSLFQVLYACRSDRHRLRELAAGSLCLSSSVVDRARRRPGADPRRARPPRAVPAARGAVHRRHGDLPDVLRALHRLHRLESELVRRPPVQRPRQFRALFNDAYLLERAPQHGLLRARRAGAIRHRLRAGAAPQRRDPGAPVLPRRLPAAVHAQPGGGELDDRQVAHGIPLRPGGDAGAPSRLGESRPSSPLPGWRASASWRWTPGSRSRS